MKSLKILWREAAYELAAWCCTSASFDYKTVERRVENEGLSFLTITLPAFAKDFERSLEAQQVDSSCFVGFHRLRRSPLPVFLGGFLSQVFDIDSGRLLDQPNIDCIFSIRELTLMFGKILLECTPARERDAMRGYIKCENEVADAALVYDPDIRSEFKAVAALLFADVLTELDNKLHNGHLVPKHGPGKTADGLRGNAKFDQFSWPVRLEEYFPFGEYALPNWRFSSDRPVHFIEPGAETPVKVVSVPKTLKTTRIIAIEPTCMQYVQQAIATELVQALESEVMKGNTRRNIVEGQIGFADQMPNRQMACIGSSEGELATLDLSEASDRVSTLHVDDLLGYWPLLQGAVNAARSTKARVPGHGTIDLVKFASMGSALTFPIEAMVFLTAVYMGIGRKLNRRVTRRDILSLRGSVRVYGDDIVVPVDCVRSVISVLEDLNFKVNTGKSFWNGKFRESCGGDYYDGEDVTPVRVRRVFPTSRFDVSEVESLVALRNLFYQRGMWKTARYLDKKIVEVLPHFPIVESTSALLGRFSFLPVRGERECPRLHRPLNKGYFAVPRIPDSPISGVGALLKSFLKQGDDPFVDPKHLERQGRPLVVDIKLGWKPPF